VAGERREPFLTLRVAGIYIYMKYKKYYFEREKI
jgi:hypothetical protein